MMTLTDAGNIYINDTPITEIDPDKLRERIGIVSQNSYIFTGTVMENVISTPEQYKIWLEIRENALFRGVDWEHGSVLENGKNLSSGQKQKITLARLLVRNPDVIVIDEGITNLDAESRKLICSAVPTLMRDKICILVSHSDDFSECIDKKLVMQHMAG